MPKPLIKHTDYDDLLDDIADQIHKKDRSDMSESERITELESQVDHLTALVYIMWPVVVLLIVWITNRHTP